MLLTNLDVDRIHDHAGAQPAPEHDQRLDPVVGEHRDPIPTPHALGGQKVDEPPSHRLELPERDPRPLIRTMNEHLLRPAAEHAPQAAYSTSTNALELCRSAVIAERYCAARLFAVKQGRSG